MKLIKILPISLTVLAIIAMLIGCGSEPSYTAEEWEQEQAKEEASKVTTEEDLVRSEEANTQREVRQYMENIGELHERQAEKYPEPGQKNFWAKSSIITAETISELRGFYVPEACEEYHSLQLQWLRTVNKYEEKMEEGKRLSDFIQETADKKQEVGELLDEADEIWEEAEKLKDEATEIGDEKDREYRRLAREYDL
jgi:cytochrome c556